MHYSLNGENDTKMKSRNLFSQPFHMHRATLKNMFVSHTRPSISPMGQYIVGKGIFFFKIDCVHSQIWFLQSRAMDFVHLKV